MIEFTLEPSVIHILGISMHDIGVFVFVFSFPKDRVLDYGLL